MQPLISVIVPVYNGERYLKNCIESIEAQSYEPLEIIVINDGSTDGTAEVCEKLAKSYENLSFITTPPLRSRSSAVRPYQSYLPAWSDLRPDRAKP